MSNPLEVFCCYARQDWEMMALLNKYLTPLQKLGQIIMWNDANLNEGVEYEKELHQHLDNCVRACRPLVRRGKRTDEGGM